MRSAAVVACVALCALAVSAQSGYYAGVGVRDLSPSQEQLDNGEVWLGGYGFWKFRGKPTGVHDPVWARSFVFADNITDTVVATAVLDFPGITNKNLHVRFAIACFDAPFSGVHRHIPFTHFSF